MRQRGEATVLRDVGNGLVGFAQLNGGLRAALLAGGHVSCRIAETDRYGRGLAVCEAGGRDINALLVTEGWAVSHGRYESQEDEARRAGRGVWGSRFDMPADWRARHPRHDVPR